MAALCPSPGVLALASGVVVPAAALALYVVPHTTSSLVVALFPLVLYAAISLVEVVLFGRRGRIQQRERPRPALPDNVLRISRSVYDQLDGEVLQMLLSSRDFDSNDYERLMRLEAMNERKKEGASQRDIERLPIVPATEGMLRSADASTCAICLTDFVVDESVRMMRCFHHFHPHCIDTWLRSKAECPICKFPAFG